MKVQSFTKILLATALFTQACRESTSPSTKTQPIKIEAKKDPIAKLMEENFSGIYYSHEVSLVRWKQDSLGHKLLAQNVEWAQADNEGHKIQGTFYGHDLNDNKILDLEELESFWIPAPLDSTGETKMISAEKEAHGVTVSLISAENDRTVWRARSKDFEQAVQIAASHLKLN